MAADIIAARLAGRLAPGLGESVAERLLLSPRLGERARTWAQEGSAEALAALPDLDRALAAAGDGALRRAVVLAGAVWHGARIRGLVRARDLQGFIEVHGPDARRAALQHAGLAPPDPGVQEPLAEAVTTDGQACVTAWLDGLGPAADALRLTLPLEMDTETGEAHRTHGPAIVRAVALAALVEPPVADPP